MALKTLKGVEQIDGFPVLHLEKPVPMEEWLELIEKYFVIVNEETNTLHSRVQNEPIKLVGVNGCQVDTILNAVIVMVDGLNQEFPCQENQDAIEYMKMALECLKARKERRESLGIEGTNAEVKPDDELVRGEDIGAELTPGEPLPQSADIPAEPTPPNDPVADAVTTKEQVQEEPVPEDTPKE